MWALSISNSRSLLYSLAKATPVARMTATITARPSTEDVPVDQADEEQHDGRDEQERRKPVLLLAGRRHAPAGPRQPSRGRCRPAAVVGLEQIDDHGQQGGGEEDLDDRLVELLEELLPERLARQRRELVGAEFLLTALAFLSRQAAFTARGKRFRISATVRMQHPQ